MSADEHDRLERYIRAIADLIGLRDWAFELMAAPAEDARARIASTEGMKRAVIWVCWDLLQKPADEIRYIITHELMHCHFEPSWIFARKMIHTDAYSGYCLMAEYGIDGAARALASFLPTLTELEPPV